MADAVMNTLWGLSVGVVYALLAHPILLVLLLWVILTPLLVWGSGRLLIWERDQRLRRRVIEARLRRDHYPTEAYRAGLLKAKNHAGKR